MSWGLTVMSCSSHKPQRRISAIQAHHRASYPRRECIPCEVCSRVNSLDRKTNVCGRSSTNSIRLTRSSGFSRWNSLQGSQTTSLNTSVSSRPFSLPSHRNRVNPTVVSRLTSPVYTGTRGCTRSMHVLWTCSSLTSWLQTSLQVWAHLHCLQRKRVAQCWLMT